MINVGIAGATGYTGSELIRIFANHPKINLTALTSESRAGEHLRDVHPQFAGLFDLSFTSINDLNFSDLDVLFLALPHKVSMGFIAEHHPLPCPVIDLSGDFRLPDADVYECWYGEKHVKPDLLNEAVYGLPELFRNEIKSGKLISNPGCYPTSTILPLAPLVKHQLIDTKTIVVDAKSGTTGAGASAKDNTHYPNVADNFSAYGLKTHRHTPEIEITLERSLGERPTIQFTPHLLPLNRGILTNTYSMATKPIDEKELRSIFAEFYQNEPFIRLRDHTPQLRYVRGTNYCDIYVTFDERTNRVITVSAIDNLVKGAAGQAVQNMNILCGFPETEGLTLPAVCP